MFPIGIVPVKTPGQQHVSDLSGVLPFDHPGDLQGDVVALRGVERGGQTAAVQGFVLKGLTASNDLGAVASIGDGFEVVSIAADDRCVRLIAQIEDL